MIWAYINYPNPHFSIHRDPSCSMIQMHQIPDQRVFKVDSSNLQSFLRMLIDQEFRFASQTGLNDVWIRIDLDTTEQDIGLVHIAQKLIGIKYKPLSSASVEYHC